MAYDPKLFINQYQPYTPPINNQLQGLLGSFPTPYAQQSMPTQGNPNPQPVDNRSGWQRFWDNAYDWFKKDIAKPTGEFIAGSPGGYEQIPTYEPHQQNALNFLLQDALQNIGNPLQGFAPIESETRRSFYENTVPQLTEQFQGGRLTSPLFASRLAAAGQGLESMLGAQRQNYAQQNRANALSQAAMGLTPQYQTYAFGATPGSLTSAGKALGKAATKLIPGQ